jgi:formate hydrogenlyase subunit 3/multisubunit Na+/H+ antiporter MnhD subunit
MSNPSPSAKRDEPGRVPVARLWLLLAIITIVGIPFVAVLWETLNEILSGHIRPGRIAVAAPLLLVFLGILIAAGRALAHFENSST